MIQSSKETRLWPQEKDIALFMRSMFRPLRNILRILSANVPSSSVDSVLDPDNRLHMTVDEQLKELLDKMDFVTSMRCSGARTRRIRLLRREINSIRYRQGQPRHSLHNGRLKEEDDDGDDEEDEDDKDVKAENGLSPTDKGG